MFNPNNIRNKGFSVQKSGYNPDEVSDYLHDVAEDYAALIKENQEKDVKIEKLVEKVNEMLAFIEERHVNAAPERVFSLENVADAHRYLEGGHSFGKAVVLCGE